MSEQHRRTNLQASSLSHAPRSATPNPDDSLMLSILKEIRSEMRMHRTMLVALSDGPRGHDRRFDAIDRRFNNVEHRISNWSGELELVLKGELMGRLTYFESQIDEKLAQMSDRLDAIEKTR